MRKLVPGISGRESPVDGCPSQISFGLQGCYFPFERPLIFNAAIQTLVTDLAGMGSRFSDTMKAADQLPPPSVLY